VVSQNPLTCRQGLLGTPKPGQAVGRPLAGHQAKRVAPGAAQQDGAIAIQPGAAVIALIAVLTVMAASGSAQEAPETEAGGGPPSSEARWVAVTIDDLPVAQSWQLSAQERREVVAGLCAVLSAHQVPATGFFNMSRHAEQPELVEMWRECGVEMGNHTWSHPHIGEVGVDAYLEDLDRGYEAVREVVGGDAVIYFRYPYLNQGFDPAIRAQIRERLDGLGSPVAPVTIDTSDWPYARGYIEALHAGDDELAARYHQAWRWNLEESTEYAEQLGRALFGREPPQILLLHGNLLNARHLGEYLDWLEARGYQFISLTEALADPAYSEEDVSFSPTGDSHWLRLQRSRSMRQ
jgi:peptidoglycan/xylan/chitin deacetylase (PgdA/CDA1 family)